MVSLLRSLAWSLVALSSLAMPILCQDLPKDMKDKIDAVIAQAYRSAATEFPCKIRTRGKADMLHWEDVDRCLNDAAAKVDWNALAKQLLDLRTSVHGVSQSDFFAAVEASLSAHVLTYDKVFSVKNARARLPLTNSLLKFLPADSLQNLPVFDRTGTQIGLFSGVYSYERSGGLASANTYRLAMFQYTDRNGNVQSASDKLLLDSFGVPWRDAMSQRGYRLTSEKLLPKR